MKKARSVHAYLSTLLVLSLLVEVLGSAIFFPNQAHASATVIIITSGTTWQVPTDWNNSSNSIEVIGAGSESSPGVVGTSGAGGNGGVGGGGGAYAKITNLTLTPSATIDIQVGQGSIAGGALTAGGDTFFNRTSGVNGSCVDSSSVCAQGGRATGSGGSGGSSIGTTVSNGGSGGSAGSAGTGGGGGGGGGGAGGPNGNGLNGVGGSAASGSDGGAGGTGGSADADAGGTGGTPGSAGVNGGAGGTDGGLGNAGTEWTTAGGGGGGGGGGGNGRNSTDAAGNGAIGGNYGSGGGAGGGGGRGSAPAITQGTGADGVNGVIIITYTPVVASASSSLTKPANNLGLVGYWSFNEGTSTVATDFSGNGNTGTLTTAGAGLPLWTSGRFGSAVSLSNTNGTYVSVGDVSPLNLTTAGTVSAWIKMSSAHAFAPVVSKMNWNADIDGYGIFFDSNGTKLQAVLGDGSAPPKALVGNTTIQTNTWYHVVETWDGTTLRLYLNGVEDNNVAQAGEVPTPSGSNFRIGRSNNTDNFDGVIDDVRVYNRALSPSEVTTLYGSGGIQLMANSQTLTRGSQLENGLVGLWTFDGGDITWSSQTTGVAYDRSGQNNTGTLTNMNRSIAPVIGKFGQGLSFDQTSTYVQTAVTSTYNFTSQDFSAFFWLKTPDLNDSDTFIDYANNGGGWRIDTNVNVLELQGFGATISANTALSDGAWHHVGVVRSGSTATFYVDSVSDGSGAVSNATTGSNNLCMGGRCGGTAVIFGTMDDVRIYNRALTVPEIKQLYKLGAVKLGP